MNVKRGDKIKVHYTGTLNDGTVFDSSVVKEPLTFTVGENMVIYGFDNGVINMKIGEKKTVHIPCLEAYGVINKELIFEVPKAELPTDMGEIVTGMQVGMVSEEGFEIPLEIIAINEEFVTMDGNHSLAGKDLIFDIELIEIIIE